MKAIIILAVAAVMSIYYGWAISILWAWFAVPLGLMAISVAHAVGLTTLVGMFFVTKKANDFDDDKPLNENMTAVLFYVIYPLVALTIGSIAKTFM